MKDSKKEIKQSNFVAFAAINPYVEDNIIKPVETELKGLNWVEYGEKNLYPNYLFDLYQNSTSLHTLIDNCKDYIAGDCVHSNTPFLTDINATELVRKMAFNLLLTGGCFLNVLRNKLGQVCKVIPLDFRNVRSSKKGEWFYYSEDFGNKSYGRGKYITYPAFDSENENMNTSIFYYKNSDYTTYAVPVYAPATKSCEIEKKIAIYHLNNLNNNFSSNYMLCFNNGQPTDEIKDEIEEMVMDKFSGVENAGRPMVSFSADKEHAPEVIKFDAEDWGERFQELKKDCRQDIFTCFRCTPNILGIPTETTGFNEQEYSGAFKIFNRSFIQPQQKTICSILDSLFGKQDTITIEPYTIDFEEGGTQVEEITSNDITEEQNNG